VTGEAHDTLRDELLRAIARADQFLPADGSGDDDYDWAHTAEMMYGLSVDGALPVVRRYADAQVAAERERIAADIQAMPTYHMHATPTEVRDLAARIARGQP
jgi:hypothetical protein